jgi:hypothetical protein
MKILLQWKANFIVSYITMWRMTKRKAMAVNVSKCLAGLTSIDQVATQGAAGQGSGRIPWRIMITGWVGAKSYAAIAFSSPLSQSILPSPGFWILILILMIYIAVMWRETFRKLASR